MDNRILYISKDKPSKDNYDVHIRSAYDAIRYLQYCEVQTIYIHEELTEGSGELVLTWLKNQSAIGFFKPVHIYLPDPEKKNIDRLVKLASNINFNTNKNYEV